MIVSSFENVNLVMLVFEFSAFASLEKLIAVSHNYFGLVVGGMLSFVTMRCWIILLYKIVMDEMLWSFNLTNTYLTIVLIVLTHVFFSFLYSDLNYANCRYVIYFHVWIKFYEMNVFLESLVDPADCNLCHAFTSL